MPKPILAELTSAVAGYNRPKMQHVREQIEVLCQRLGLRPPSRAAIYATLRVLPVPRYRLSNLPVSVQQALYNFGGDSEIPAHQITFYCLNYGDERALCFAAGLPWLALHQARYVRGWRAKSRGLLDAIEVVRR
jgi:hypothetical protein